MTIHDDWQWTTAPGWDAADEERAAAIRRMLDDADAREAALLESMRARYGTGSDTAPRPVH
jgi:hypothetical protein